MKSTAKAMQKQDDRHARCKGRVRIRSSCTGFDRWELGKGPGKQEDGEGVLERVWDGLKDAGKAVFPITIAGCSAMASNEIEAKKAIK